MSVVGAVILSLVNVLYPLRVSRTVEFDPFFYKWAIVILVLIASASMVRLWFARDASRISLAHAFLLVALTSGVGSSILSVASLRHLEGDYLSPYGFTVVAGILIVWVWATILSIWALAHFDGLRHESRRRVVIALLVLGAFAAIPYFTVARGIDVGDYVGAMVGVAIVALPTVIFTLIILGLTYLVRVRQPPQPPTGLSATKASAAGKAVDYTDYH